MVGFCAQIGKTENEEFHVLFRHGHAYSQKQATFLWKKGKSLTPLSSLMDSLSLRDKEVKYYL
jgi:hypothetical protein